MLILIFLTSSEGFLILQSANYIADGREPSWVEEGTHLLGSRHTHYQVTQPWFGSVRVGL